MHADGTCAGVDERHWNVGPPRGGEREASAMSSLWPSEPVIVVSGAVVSTVNCGSPAWTGRRCPPRRSRGPRTCARRRRAPRWCGDGHAAKAVGRRRAALERRARLVEENVKLGVVSWSARRAGVDRRCGAVVSTVNVRVAGVASTLPAASIARTEKVCAPSARRASDCGDGRPRRGRARAVELALERRARLAR